MFLEELKSRFGDEIAALESVLHKLSLLYKNIPVTETAKKNWSESNLKLKSAWYACLVNGNIDVLLLPEYLESRQSRNILLKKETDQYFKAFENFDFLNGKRNKELFECILQDEQSSAKASFDLFSAQVKESVSCPEALEKMFECWEETEDNASALERIIASFVEWHQKGMFSFNGNRQLVLWVNYQFKKEFGNASLRVNHEQYFFHHWNKESRDLIKSVSDLIGFWKQETEHSIVALRDLYKQSIGFSRLKSNQKIVANHLFHTGFDVHYPMPIQISQYPALKSLLRKGFVQISDFGSKTDFDKYESLMRQLIEIEFLMPVRDGEMYYCLNTSGGISQSRLGQYVNVSRPQQDLYWDEFKSQNIEPIIRETIEIPIEAAVQEATEISPVMEIPDFKPKKKKVFFG